MFTSKLARNWFEMNFSLVFLYFLGTLAFLSVLPAHVFAIQTVMHSNFWSAGIYMRQWRQRAWKLCSFILLLSRQRTYIHTAYVPSTLEMFSQLQFVCWIEGKRQANIVLEAWFHPDCKLIAMSISLTLKLRQRLGQLLIETKSSIPNLHIARGNSLMRSQQSRLPQFCIPPRLKVRLNSFIAEHLKVKFIN